MSQENLLQRIKLNTLYPPLVKKIQDLVANCRARGQDYWALAPAVRTFEEQNAIYAIGRTIPCDQCVLKGIKDPCGHLGTKAMAGFSPHNYGLAVDFCPDRDLVKPGLQPSWKRENYRVLAEEAAKLGLEAGYNWKFMDNPHIQLPLGKYGIKWLVLLDLHRRKGLPGVWAYLDTFSW